MALPQRLVVLARALPAGAEALHRRGCAHLDARDLADSRRRGRGDCRVGFHLEHVTDPMVARLQRVTKGWTAATVLAAARAASTGRPIEVEGLDVGTASGRVEVIETLLAEAVRSIGRDAAAQLARLPLLDASLVAVALGDEALFARALTGAPAPVPVRDGWWEGCPARFASRSRRSARWTRPRWCAPAPATSRAVRCARRSSCSAPPGPRPRWPPRWPPPHRRRWSRWTSKKLESLVDGLSDAHLDAHPEALMHLARKRRIATRFDASVRLLDRVGRLAAASGDAALAREVDAEHALELERQLRPEDAAPPARCSTASPAEMLTMARGSQALAKALCWRQGRGPSRRGRTRARRGVRRAVRLYRELGMPSAAAAVVPYWAINIEFVRGSAPGARDARRAARTRHLELRRRAFILCFRSWVAAELGMDDVCRTVPRSDRVAGQTT